MPQAHEMLLKSSNHTHHWTPYSSLTEGSQNLYNATIHVTVWFYNTDKPQTETKKPHVDKVQQTRNFWSINFSSSMDAVSLA